MSRIGRKPVEIPKGVTVSITKDIVSAKGPKGTLTLKRHKDIEIKQDKDEARTSSSSSARTTRDRLARPTVSCARSSTTSSPV